MNSLIKFFSQTLCGLVLSIGCAYGAQAGPSQPHAIVLDDVVVDLLAIDPLTETPERAPLSVGEFIATAWQTQRECNLTVVMCTMPDPENPGAKIINPRRSVYCRITLSNRLRAGDFVDPLTHGDIVSVKVFVVSKPADGEILHAGIRESKPMSSMMQSMLKSKTCAQKAPIEQSVAVSQELKLKIDDDNEVILADIDPIEHASFRALISTAWLGNTPCSLALVTSQMHVIGQSGNTFVAYPHRSVYAVPRLASWFGGNNRLDPVTGGPVVAVNVFDITKPTDAVATAGAFADADIVRAVVTYNQALSGELTQLAIHPVPQAVVAHAALAVPGHAAPAESVVPAHVTDINQIAHRYDAAMHELNLSHLPITQIDGSVFTQIAGQWPDLELLNIRYCPLASLPTEIGQLQNLQMLDLTGCPLVSLPAEIGQLQNLQILSLYSCSLVSLPAEIGQLHNLQVLNLGSCSLVSLPAEIGQLHNLQVLNLDYCPLVSLPAEIGQLHNLQRLNLAHCLLVSLPVEIGQLHNLQVLNLGSCPLVSLPAAIGLLQNLQQLSLADCTSLGSLPAEIGSLQNLEILFVGGAMFVQTPDWLALRAQLLNDHPGLQIVG